MRLYSPAYVPQLGVGLLFALLIAALRRWIPTYLALPVAFVSILVVLDLILFEVVPDEVTRVWFLPSFGKLTLWWPLSSVTRPDIHWGVIAQTAGDIGALSVITALSMLLDVSSLEVARQKSADLDSELRTNGIANVVAGVLGGMGGNLSLNGAVMLEESGAVTRWGGVFVGLTCAVILFAGADIGTYVPKAVLGGMLYYLGAVLLIEVWESPVQLSWTDWIFGPAIMLVICNFGYLQGVGLGILVACVMFALNYSRVGVIKRHLTRQDFSSNVDRSREQSLLLEQEGQRLHELWLSGFIFFGSSNVIFEHMRQTIEQQRNKSVEYVVLDFSRVAGLDTSAALSFIKLRDFCDWHQVTLAFSGFNDGVRHSFERMHFVTRNRRHQIFDTRNEALEWCEEMILMNHQVGAASSPTFEEWLEAEVGPQADVARLKSYLDLHEFNTGELLFHQGEPSDSVDLIVSGCIVITIDDENSGMKLRRVTGAKWAFIGKCPAQPMWWLKNRPLFIGFQRNHLTAWSRRILRLRPLSTPSSFEFSQTGWNSPIEKLLPCHRVTEESGPHIGCDIRRCPTASGWQTLGPTLNHVAVLRDRCRFASGAGRLRRVRSGRLGSSITGTMASATSRHTTARKMPTKLMPR